MITLLLVAAMLAPQGNITIRRGTPVPAGDIDVRCFVTWENCALPPCGVPLSYTLGALECCGDAVFTKNSDAQTANSPVNVGTYAARFPTGNDYFDIESVDDTDPFDVASGSVGLWVYMTTAPTTAISRLVKGGDFTGDHDTFSLGVDTSGNLVGVWELNGVAESTCTSTLTLSTGIWYFIEARWVSDTASDDLITVSRDDTDFSCTGLSLTEITGVDQTEVGERGSGDSTYFSIDTFMLSDDPNRDFYADRNETDEANFSNSCN